MGGFSLSGLGGGLDVRGIVDQLMFIESQPIRSLEQEKDQHQLRINAYNELSGMLSSLSSKLAALLEDDAFSVKTAASSDESLLTASAGGDAPVRVAAGAEPAAVGEACRYLRLPTGSAAL